MALSNGPASSQASRLSSRQRELLANIRTALEDQPELLNPIMEHCHDDDTIRDITPGYNLTAVERVRIGETGRDAQAGPDSPIPEG